MSCKHNHHRAKLFENYYSRFGCYPKQVLADRIYGNRENRNYLKRLGIRFGGKPLGRPKKLLPQESAQQCKQQYQDEVNRIPIEGKFGQGKTAYGLGRVEAKLASTSECWVRAAFLVMNVLELARIFYAFFQFIQKVNRLLLPLTVLQKPCLRRFCLQLENHKLANAT